MLSDDRELLESDIGRRIIDIAVRDYRLIFKTQSFNDIPADIVIRIFDRCDLPVESEFELAQSAIAWVAARPERVRNAYRVFSCIRITNLTAEQHNDMINLINLMPYFTAAVSTLAYHAFNSADAYRVCTIGAHTEPHYKRCGDQMKRSHFTYAHFLVIV
ncbi:hypothetical protein Tcan_05107 [Toxocara canis]|uniref:BACK domain-containing protein n=1 Tax=Toxocara canis TaxID=6265 RepID=A0A0B2VWQ5_TOXCA|nr:hypothetical protein Tcan_05107 [Toxocara canis]